MVVNVKSSSSLMSMSLTGSEASLLKHGLPSSVCASRRTLNSQDNILGGPPASSEDGHQEPDSAVQTAAAGRQSPSYLKVSRCVGGYSSFTSYSSDRMTSSQNGAASRTVSTAETDAGVITDCYATPKVVTVVPKGGQRCQLTVVDSTVASLCSVPSNNHTDDHCGRVDAVTSQLSPLSAVRTVANGVLNSIADDDEKCKLPGAVAVQSSDRRSADSVVKNRTVNVAVVDKSQTATMETGKNGGERVSCFETPPGGVCEAANVVCLLDSCRGGDDVIRSISPLVSARDKECSFASPGTVHSTCNGVCNGARPDTESAMPPKVINYTQCHTSLICKFRLIVFKFSPGCCVACVTCLSAVIAAAVEKYE